MKKTTSKYIEVDNFEEISEILFGKDGIGLSEGEFFYLQIFVRGKDGHNVNGNNKNRLINYYLVNSKEYLLSKKDEIIAICKATNARAYIAPSPKSYKSASGLALELATHDYVSENWIGVRRSFSSACGQTSIKGKKRFIIDLDDMTTKDKKYHEISAFIRDLTTYKDRNIYTVETLGGLHIIAPPFDLKKFSDTYPKIDVHKNNPTLLYYYKNLENYDTENKS